MDGSVKLISLLRKCFLNDKISMYYHGSFDDTFTHKLISIADYDIGKQAKRRVAFLMSESFQNIVRHGDDQISKGNASLFGIRGIEHFMHIFSSNLVNTQDKSFLENRLNFINNQNPEQLKELYTRVLDEGILGKKGGAGLGLIEIARKSTSPIQIEFKKLAGDLFTFNMQIDLLIDEQSKQAAEDSLSIQENIALYDIVLEHNIIFLYKGDFGDEIITPMLNILQDNTTSKRNDSAGFKIYHTAVELMQNVSKHTAIRENKKEGIFALNKTKKGYYLCTGNYIDNNGDKLIAFVNTLNSMSKADLDILYRSELKTSTLHSDSNAGVGLIDLRRSLMTSYDIKIGNDKNGNYLIIGIEVPFL